MCSDVVCGGRVVMGGSPCPKDKASQRSPQKRVLLLFTVCHHPGARTSERRSPQGRKKRTIEWWWEEGSGEWVLLIKIILTNKHNAWMANNILMITKAQQKKTSQKAFIHWRSTWVEKIQLWKKQLCLKLVKSKKHHPACDMQRYTMHHDHHENISNLEICNAASVISADVVLGDRFTHTCTRWLHTDWTMCEQLYQAIQYIPKNNMSTILSTNTHPTQMKKVGSCASPALETHHTSTGIKVRKRFARVSRCEKGWTNQGLSKTWLSPTVLWHLLVQFVCSYETLWLLVLFKLGTL